MKTLLICLITLGSFTASAATYLMKGSYFLNEADKRPVNFSVRWFEKDGKVTGIYSDSKFETKSIVNGLVNDNGRSFEVILPSEEEGIKSIVLIGPNSVPLMDELTLPFQMILRDKIGTSKDTKTITVSLGQGRNSASDMQAEEARPCSEGFGDLVGFCGQYSGVVVSEPGGGENCEQLTSEDTTLELDKDANLILQKSANDSLIIGRLPVDPSNKNIDLMSRHCESGKDCQRINLIGAFSTKDGRPHFEGSFVSINEKNNQGCRYSMVLERVSRL